MQAPRDTDVLDCWYHYDPVDYLWTSLDVNYATLTNGVAIGSHGPRLIRLLGTGKLVSDGPFKITFGQDFPISTVQVPLVIHEPPWLILSNMIPPILPQSLSLTNAWPE